MLRHGRNVAIYVNGVDISGELNAINPVSEQELADVPAFQNVGHTFYPGLAKDSGTIEALYNDNEKAVFEGLLGQSTGYAMMIPFGQSLGAPAYATNEIMLKDNKVKSIVTDVNRASITFDVDNYPFEQCTMLSSGSQPVGIASTGQNSAFDFGSASATTGGAAYLQVLSINSTSGTLTVSVQTSSTGAFAGEQATTATFAVASTEGAERVAISSQFYQYARAVWVNAGSSCNFALALKRY